MMFITQMRVHWLHRGYWKLQLLDAAAVWTCCPWALYYSSITGETLCPLFIIKMDLRVLCYCACNSLPTVYYSCLSCKFIYLGTNIDFTWCLGHPLITQKRFRFVPSKFGLCLSDSTGQSSNSMLCFYVQRAVGCICSKQNLSTKPTDSVTE
jgi:hypothetical protein